MAANIHIHCLARTARVRTFRSQLARTRERERRRAFAANCDSFRSWSWTNGKQTYIRKSSVLCVCSVCVRSVRSIRFTLILLQFWLVLFGQRAHTNNAKKKRNTVLWRGSSEQTTKQSWQKSKIEIDENALTRARHRLGMECFEAIKAVMQ